ncbi:Nucleotidyltransferase family protein [Striga hermonthica]|uniref:Nucleotidyltransferase family protein n=1 Tax=Striga hermonthica TaxID=68872 RepID=A0A9N7NR31_STRHE|nr:Nucleotidyltransferase family protein [Striga hermonthica]
MAWRKKVLQIKAGKFELKKLQNLKVTKELVLALDPLLEDVYANRRPKPKDYEVRRELVCVFNKIAEEIYGRTKNIPVVVEFGSFVMDLFSTSSDLDLSVNFRSTSDPFPREKKIQTLRKFARKLYALQSIGHVYGVLPITTAKVPILKCVDRGTGVECDISVENRDGVLKSQIIHIISSIDERFHKLSFLMKTWAKAHNINSSKDKTLNSLSIILLVAFHLQTREPPILPPFSCIFKADGTDPEKLVESVRKFSNYGKRNKESLSELFITLLFKLSSVEKLWPKGLCASPCSGSWTSKTWDSKVTCISVEDFTDPSQNVARAVGPSEVKRIYKCINVSIRHVLSFMDGKIGGEEVKELLFRQEGAQFSRRGHNHKPANPRWVGKRKKRHFEEKSMVERKKARMSSRNTKNGAQGTIEEPYVGDTVKRPTTGGGWEESGGGGGGGGGGGWDEIGWPSKGGGCWGGKAQHDAEKQGWRGDSW